jgi:hypothetical protein
MATTPHPCEACEHATVGSQDHALTITWDHQRGAEAISTGTCLCEWQESASSQSEVTTEYHWHLLASELTKTRSLLT